MNVSIWFLFTVCLSATAVAMDLKVLYAIIVTLLAVCIIASSGEIVTYAHDPLVKTIIPFKTTPQHA